MNEFWIRVKTEEQLEAAAESDFFDNIILEAKALRCFLPAGWADRLKAKIYPALPDAAREAGLEKIYEVFDEWQGNFDGICIKNIDEIGILKEHNYKGKVIADEFLYAYNSAAVNFYRTVFEDIDFIAPAELTLKELANTEKNADVKFIYKIYGYQKLMTTAQCFSEAYSECKEKQLRLRDETGGIFTATSECEHCYDNIYNAVPTYMQDKLSEFGENARLFLDFTIESRKETAKIFEYLKNALNYGTCPVPEKFTRGHYYAGAE